MAQVFAISVIDGDYEKIIYVNADKVKVTKLCSSIDELDASERLMFDNGLGRNFAVFDWESLA